MRILQRPSSRRIEKWGIVKTSVALVSKIIQPTIKALGMVLWGVEHVQKGKYSVLRIFIDSEGGITVTDCAKLSRQISGLLDVESPISGEYTLEVSSPGLDRPLFKVDQFEKFVGDEVKVQMRVPIEGKRRFKGVIESVSGETICLKKEEETFKLQHSEIDKASVVYSE